MESTLWPRGIPGPQDAFAALQEPIAVPAPLYELTYIAVHLLPRDRALWAPELVGAAAAFWRLGVAAATKPPDPSAVDERAREELIVAADQALSALTRLSSPKRELIESRDAVRAALAHKAVHLGDPPPEQPAATPARFERAATAQQPVVKAVRRATVHRPHPSWRWGILAASALLSIAYHVFVHPYRWAPRPGPLLAAPRGMAGVRDPRSSIAFLHRLPGQTVDADALEALKQNALLRGDLVKEAGDGRVIILPKEALQRSAP